MDHKTFLSTLPPDLTTQLTQKRTLPGLIHLIAHASLILLTGTLITIRVPFWPLLLPLHGILLTFLFTLQHETTHKTPFANQTLNEWVGRTIGLIILLPFQWFRYFHLAHHRHTNDPDKDPELLAGAKPVGGPSLLAYVSGLPYWVGMIRQIARSAFGQTHAPYLPKPALPRIRAEARWMLFIYGLCALSLPFTPLLIHIWLLPLLIGQPFLRLFLLAEHARCPAVADKFQNTRTTLTTRAIRWLTWNMPYHAEHHAMPNAPFHALPRLHQITRQHLQVIQPGYVQFSRTYLPGKTDQ